MEYSPWTADRCSAGRHTLSRWLNFYNDRRNVPLLRWQKPTQIIKSYSSKLNLSIKLILRSGTGHMTSPLPLGFQIKIPYLVRLPHASQSLWCTIFWQRLEKSAVYNAFSLINRVPTTGISDKYWSPVDTCRVVETVLWYKYWPLIRFPPTIGKSEAK